MVEQDAACLQLNCEIRYAEDDCNEDGQQAHRFAAVVMLEHFTGCDEVIFLAEEPLPFQEKDTGEWDRDRVERGKGVRESGFEQGSGMADERPAAKGGGRCCQDENPKWQLTAGDEIIRGCFRLTETFNSPENAVDPVKRHAEPDPEDHVTHIIFPPLLCPTGGYVRRSL